MVAVCVISRTRILHILHILHSAHELGAHLPDQLALITITIDPSFWYSSIPICQYHPPH